MAKKNPALAALSAPPPREEPESTPAAAAPQAAPPPPAQPRGRKAALVKDQPRGSIYMPPEVYEQLRRIQFEERVSYNTLYLRALDLLFAKLGNRSIKELTGEDPWT